MLRFCRTGQYELSCTCSLPLHENIILSSAAVTYAGIPCRLRRRCYPLARVQPALKDSVRKRADIAALAGTLYIRKASAMTVTQAAQLTHRAFPAPSLAQIDKLQLKGVQHHGFCLPFGSLGRLWPHTCAAQGPGALPSLQGGQTHTASSREAPCCGTPPPEDAHNICKWSPADRQDEIIALTKTGQGLCPCRMLPTRQPIGVQPRAIANHCILISTALSMPLA